MVKEVECTHKFRNIETLKNRTSAGFNNQWKRTDIYYCEKCLKYQDKTREITQREKPEWY